MTTITRQQLMDCLVPKETGQQEPSMAWVVLGIRTMSDPVELTAPFAMQLYEQFGAYAQTWAKIKALPGFPVNIG